jgi:CelD/BcsL family acetyltransferase involved in cellulose biosynthesis
MSTEFGHGSVIHSTGDSDQDQIAGSPVVDARGGGVELIESVAEEWRGLCDTGPADEPFFRPEWIVAYMRAFVPGGHLLLVTARSNGRLRAVLPLVEERRLLWGLPVRTLTVPANVHVNRFDVVRCAGSSGDQALHAMWHYLENRPGWDQIDLPFHLPGGGLEELVQIASRAGFIVEKWESRHSVHVPLRDQAGESEPWMVHTKPRFRKKLRRRWRKLNAVGPLALRRVDQADPKALQTFYEIERSGWKGSENSAIACRPHTRQFYDEIAREAARFGYLSVYFLESSGRPVAGQLGFSYRGRYLLAKGAYNEEYGKYGPGHLLVYAVLRDCWERGLREFDFLGPWMEDETYWARDTRPLQQSWILRPGPYGRLLYTIRFAIKAHLKSILRRQ